MPTKLRISIFFIIGMSISSATSASTIVDLGRLVLCVSDSPTAQVFHIVDQLSEWDQYAHKQYVRWAAKSLNLNQEDRAMLQKHAELRRARGWGQGFEQSFLVEGSIEEAATEAIKAKRLAKDEAILERDVLLHFAPKLSVLLNQNQQNIQVLKDRLISQQSELRPKMDQLARFSESSGTTRVPVFLVANTDSRSGGGEANGGRLVVETPSPDPIGFLLHESLHALVARRLELIKAAAALNEMNWEELNEGVAYAMAPGLTDDADKRDLLAEQLARFVLRGTPASDSYARSYMIAMIIRPLLRASLAQGESLKEFLPQAVQRWKQFSGP